MNEKMTDEDFTEAKRALHAGDSSEADWTDTWGDKVFAHLAALTGEREAVRRDIVRLGELTRDGVTMFPETTEGAVMAHAVAGVLTDRDALRERAQALEHLRNDYHTLMNSRGDWQSRAEHAERRLSAMLQRAEPVRQFIQRVLDAGKEVQTIIVRGEEVAMLGGPEARAFLDVVGEDATGAAPNLAEPLHCCGTTTMFHRDGCPVRQALAPLFTPASPEPSTAGAFATVRRGWQVMEALEVPFGHSGDEESGQHDEDCALCAHEALLAWSEAAAHALSLLERRMGVQDAAIRIHCAAIRETVKTEQTLSPEVEPLGWLMKGARDILRHAELMEAALTDAPPVFTLEEVEAEMLRAGISGRQYDAVVAWLAALRT